MFVDIPPEDFIKINEDGFSFGISENANFEGVLRNDRGNWIYVFSKSCGELLIYWPDL